MPIAFKNWIIAARPWALPASTMPWVLTVSYLFYHQANLGGISWVNGLIALIGVILMHSGGNLISDFYDYKYGVDREDSFGGERMLVKGIFQPKTILIYGLSLLFTAILIGLYLTVQTGFHLLWIGAAGALGALFYFALKARALGDLLIFVLYGPMIGLGTAYVMTGGLLWEVLLLNVPVAMLVVNILHANNTRDIQRDAQANLKTQAMLLGVKASKIQYVVLALGAYLMVILMNVLGMVHPMSLLTLLTLPIAHRNMRLMLQLEEGKPEMIKDLDGMSAQLVLVFSVVFAAMNVVGALI